MICDGEGLAEIDIDSGNSPRSGLDHELGGLNEAQFVLADEIAIHRRLVTDI